MHSSPEFVYQGKTKLVQYKTKRFFRIFEIMFTLEEAWFKMQGHAPYPGWDGKLVCVDTDADTTFRTNRTQGFMSAYTFTLVLKGWLSLTYP